MTSKLASIALAIAVGLGGLAATVPSASAASATIVVRDGHGRTMHRDRHHRREIRRERRHERRAIHREMRHERRHERQMRRHYRHQRHQRAPHVLYRVN